MAKRLNPHHQQSVRAKIQAAQLVNRLQAHAFGKLEMTDEQRDSAKFLISRCLSPPVPKSDDGETAKGPLVISWL